MSKDLEGSSTSDVDYCISEEEEDSDYASECEMSEEYDDLEGSDDDIFTNIGIDVGLGDDSHMRARGSGVGRTAEPGSGEGGAGEGQTGSGDGVLRLELG